MLQFLDKSTLSYAAIFGIIEDTVGSMLHPPCCPERIATCLRADSVVQRALKGRIIPGWRAFSTLVSLATHCA